MGENAINGIIAVGTAIVGLAVIAVILSKQSNTSGVLTAAGTALSTGIKAAVSPLIGGGSAPVDNYGDGYLGY